MSPLDICVVGLGKLGLPLAVQFAAKGHRVTGADVAPAVVEAVNQGRPPFPREAGLDEALKRVVAEGRLRATTDTSAAVAGAEAVVWSSRWSPPPTAHPTSPCSTPPPTRSRPGCAGARWSATRPPCRWASPGAGGRRAWRPAPG